MTTHREAGKAEPVEVDPVEARIRALVAEAPPITASMRSRLRVLLSGHGRRADRPGDTA